MSKSMFPNFSKKPGIVGVYDRVCWVHIFDDADDFHFFLEKQS